MNFQKTTLDNGLEIVAEIDDDAFSTSLGFFVRTGARDENDKNSGISHFLEHMVFKGTDRRTAADVNRELDELGGFSNASTGEETTCFYAKVLPELQERTIDLLSDILRPSLRAEDFETEKQVVLEEMKMYEDQPPYLVDEKWREYFWSGHPLSRSVIGSHESVAGITPEMMRDYFEKRYSPENVVFAACGQIDFDRLVKWVDSRCGKWRPFAAPRESWRAKGKPGSRVIKHEGATQEYVFQVVDAAAESDPDRFAANMLAWILGGSVGSRLFWELVDSGRADEACLYPVNFSDSGAYVTYLACNPEDVDDNLASIREILMDAQKNGVTEDELARAKSRNLTSIVLGSENPLTRLFNLGEDWLCNRRYYSVADELQIVRNLTLDDVNASMKKYPFDNPLTVAVGSLSSLRDF